MSSTCATRAAAVHMTDAWGRLTGERPGIALVTGGPGGRRRARVFPPSLLLSADQVIE